MPDELPLELGVCEPDAVAEPLPDPDEVADPEADAVADCVGVLLGIELGVGGGTDGQLLGLCLSKVVRSGRTCKRAVAANAGTLRWWLCHNRNFAWTFRQRTIPVCTNETIRFIKSSVSHTCSGDLSRSVNGGDVSSPPTFRLSWWRKHTLQNRRVTPTFHKLYPGRRAELQLLPFHRPVQLVVTMSTSKESKP